MTEQVLDSENWKLEAEAVINDVKDHVSLIEVSKNLQSTNQRIYINLTTIEGRNYCVELSALGFRIVGMNFDQTNQEQNEYFETPYSLLNKVSSQFHVSFENALLAKLSQLNEK